MRKLSFQLFLCFHIIVIIIIISITLKNNFTKERGMYEHIRTYFIYKYLHMCIHIYTYLCLKSCLLAVCWKLLKILF